MVRRLLLAAVALAAAHGAGSLPAAAQTTEPADTESLVEKLASGRPYIVVTLPRTIPLREGDWSYPFPSDYWIAFEGRYDPESGIWQSSGFGFNPNRNEYHSCPPDLDRSRFICGGSHSWGHRLERRVAPRDHVLVILENELTFDDAGNVYRNGELIGVVAVPPAP